MRRTTDIENPNAYYAAIERRVKANANVTRRRKFEAEIAGDSPEFRAWLLGITTDELEALRIASQEEYDSFVGPDSKGPAHRAYDAAWKAWRQRVGHVPTFLADAIRDWGGLTEKQLAFARKAFAERLAKSDGIVAERAAERANAQPAPTGRVEVSGEIVSTKVVENNFGSTIKMLVKTDAGWKLWATLPSAVEINGSLKGSRITIRATVEPSQDDPTFAFGKRPTLVSITPTLRNL